LFIPHLRVSADIAAILRGLQGKICMARGVYGEKKPRECMRALRGAPLLVFAHCLCKHQGSGVSRYFTT
jgi:hypothetical protein